MANKTVIDGVAGLKSFVGKDLGTSDWRTMTFEAIQKEAKSIFLLDSLGSKLRMRGQMLFEERLDLLLFIGTPWFSDITQLEKVDFVMKGGVVYKLGGVAR